ncbi:MAG: Fur family transcriptional regulator [Verrucomicrobiia bacterium]|jgi:Fur family ferric uptake transcriptional regulator
MEENCFITEGNINYKASYIIEALRECSLKITNPRLAVIKALAQQTKPVTIKELHQIVGKENCDLATIYRLFNSLEKNKLLQRVDFGDGVARYEVLTNDNPHHHHIVCIHCAKVVKIKDCFVEQFQKNIAEQSGFKSVTHKLEFFGICPKCQ